MIIFKAGDVKVTKTTPRNLKFCKNWKKVNLVSIYSIQIQKENSNLMVICWDVTRHTNFFGCSVNINFEGILWIILWANLKTQINGGELKKIHNAICSLFRCNKSKIYSLFLLKSWEMHLSCLQPGSTRYCIYYK